MPRANNGPQLKPNSRGIYEIRWTEAGRSKRSSTGTPHLPSAQKVLANFLLLDERDRQKQGDGPLMVLDAIGDPEIPGADYWHEHVVPNVVGKELARYTIAKIKQHFGHLAVADIMPSDVTAYVEKRRAGIIGRPSVNHTISTELSLLNAAINHAVKEKRLPKAEQPFIKLPGTSEPRDRWLTAAEADKLLAAALDGRSLSGRLPRTYRFIALALNTASRKAAVQGLTREQVDMTAGMIHLNPVGRKQTKKRRSRVPISNALRPILERILREIPDKPDAFLLDDDGDIRHGFKNAVERAGLGKDVTPHVLRHTKATWMAQAGVSMFDIAGVLGDSVATVTKTYAHHHPDYLRNAINIDGRKAA